MGLSPAILIPAYNPDEKLLALLKELDGKFGGIVIVDDGSTKGREIFPEAAKYAEKVLVHEKNRGKGAALKTGFAYIGDRDVITVDADGQHKPADIAKIAKALETQRDGLVLGVRSFTGKVPFRSRFGNFWTRLFFFLMTGLSIRDTQTGLRGIPSGLLKRIAAIPGDRYEYEMAMLADAKSHDSRPVQIPIETVYIDENATSHFNPLLDTVRIYRSLLQFCLSSVMGFLLDYIIFIVVTKALAAAENPMPRRDYILAGIVSARTVSALFNYFYNRFVVFRVKNTSGRHTSFLKYFALVIVVGALSYALTASLSALVDLRGAATAWLKAVADTLLFVLSYLVQKKFVFRHRRA